MFLTRDNYNYIGKYPGSKYYDVDNMKEPERKELLDWLEERRDETFDARRSLIEYCIKDCELLLKGALAYAMEYQAATGIYPYSNACTIASISMKTFR